jgi:WXG100 family type VII secretion target
MADVNVTYQDMKDAAARLRQGQEDMNGKLVELGGLIEALTSNGFQTQVASQTYADQFHQFQTGTKQAVDALEGLASFLEAAAEALANTDTELSNSIRS